MRNKNSPYCTIGFRDIKLRLFGIPIAAFLMPIAFFNSLPFSNGSIYWLEFLITLAHVCTFWHMDRGIVILFRKKYPYFSQYKKRLILQSITIILLSLILESLSIYFLHTPSGQSIVGDAFQPTNTQFLVATLFVTVTIMAIYETMYAFDMWSIGISQNERLKKENLVAQLDALKSQVNPHFLFNSLNTLAALIPENSKLAVEFVEKLSRIYRFVLEIKDKQFIPLYDELKAIDAYQFLLKMRFGENIQFSREIKLTDENLLIIPLSVQMLIENAVKHNIISKANPLKIDIRIEDGFLIVKNTLQIKKQIQASTKTGLINIKERYAISANKEPKFFEDGAQFVAKLPLISLKDPRT